MPHDVRTTVQDQHDLGHGYFLIRLEAPAIAAEARAGEFVMIGLPDLDSMLIRRPFSVARVQPGPEEGTPESIEILYKVYGPRTAALSGLRPGSCLTVLGPLGRGFWLPEPDIDIELVLVAGGIGSAIFPLLLQQAPAAAKRATLFYGGASAADLPLRSWFRERCRKVVPATLDGSLGHRALVTLPLTEYLDGAGSGRRLVLACGPRGMLRSVAEICLARSVPCQLAMEETMACGFGVCLGCVVEKREAESDFDRFVRVCTEGPVFDAREILP
jgi:dihydroorotate dehydrogenase electron transfer subunit